jgi:Flp pilus assembly protein TadG
MAVRVMPPCVRRFGAAQGGVAAVEFALNGAALFAFVFVTINLGDLALILGTMQKSVSVAARAAAVQTGVTIAASQNGASCVTAAQIVGYFNGAATPVLPTATAPASAGSPAVQASWTNASGSGGAGAFLTVTAKYSWTPIGLPPSLTGFQLTTVATDMVEGTSGATTSCN